MKVVFFSLMVIVSHLCGVAESSCRVILSCDETERNKSVATTEMTVTRQQANQHGTTLLSLGERLTDLEDNYRRRLEKLLPLKARMENITSVLQEIHTVLSEEEASCSTVQEDLSPIDTSNNSNCDEIYNQGLTEDGVYNITVSGRLMTVYCEMQENGHNWLVPQRRRDGSQDFFKGWQEYSTGFGDLLGEFWLGLENLHVITSSTSHGLRVDLEDWNGNTAYAEYSGFSIGSSSTNYRLTVGGYSGTAGDALAYHNNRPFSTKDRDNDGHSDNDAVLYHGGWWYYRSHHSNLNGRYMRKQNDCSGVRWARFPGSTDCNSMKKTEMKIKPN